MKPACSLLNRWVIEYQFICRYPSSLGTVFGTVNRSFFLGGGGGGDGFGRPNLVLVWILPKNHRNRLRYEVWTVRYLFDKQIFLTKFFPTVPCLPAPVPHICRTRVLGSGNWSKTIQFLISWYRMQPHTQPSRTFVHSCGKRTDHRDCSRIVNMPPPPFQALNQLFDLANCSRTDDAWQFKFYCISPSLSSVERCGQRVLNDI